MKTEIDTLQQMKCGHEVERKRNEKVLYSKFVLKGKRSDRCKIKKYRARW